MTTEIKRMTYPELIKREKRLRPQPGDSWTEYAEQKHLDSMLPKSGILKQIEEGVRDD